MTQTNTKNTYTEAEKPRSTFPTGLITTILVVIFIGLFIYIFWQKKSISHKITTLEKRISDKQAAIEDFTQGKSVEDHLNGVVALEAVLEEQIDWSQANRAIAAIGTELQNEVSFEEYSSNDQGTFQLRGVAANPEGIAKTIERFTNSSQFLEPFVTNISEQSNNGTSFGSRTPINIFPFNLTFVFTPAS